MSRSESEVKVITSTMNNVYSFTINFKQTNLTEEFFFLMIIQISLYSSSEQSEFKYLMFSKQNKSSFKLQICDVISRWEKSYQDFHSGKLDSNKTIRFLYKNRFVFWIESYFCSTGPESFSSSYTCILIYIFPFANDNK